VKNGKQLTARARLVNVQTVISPAETAFLLIALSAGALSAQERPPGRPTDLSVGSVRFTGNKSIDQLTLEVSISTSTSNWIYKTFLRIGARRRWDELEFRRDVIRVQLLYRQHGFYEATVDTVVDRRDQLIDVTFRIAEGPPILVDTLSITGVDSIAGHDGLADFISLKVNKPFNRFLLEASADSIVLWARNRGYPWATVFRNYTVDRLGRRARVSFDVLTGPSARIGEVVFHGTSNISQRTVRRELVVAVGDRFRQDDLFESQRQLYRSDLFRYASVGVAPDSTVGGVDSLVRLRVQVAEAAPVQIKAGAGYGTIDCFRASSHLSVLNILGAARRLDVIGVISKIGVGKPLDFGFENTVCRELADDPFSTRINYLTSVTVTQPVTLLRRGTVSIGGFAERRSEINAYLVESFGGTLGHRFRYGRRNVLPISILYRLSRDQTIADPATYCIYFNQCDPAALAPFAAPQRKGTLTLSVGSNQTNSPIEPTRGYTWSFEGTTAAAWLGSQIIFDRVVGEAVHYAPLGRMVLSARLRGGFLRPGQSRIGDTQLPYVPPPDRFYLGGPTTVRGFGRNEMGSLVYVQDTKIDTNVTTGVIDTLPGSIRSSPIGGSAIVLANIELRMPTPLFARRLAVNAFVDGGEMWDYNGTTHLPGGFKITPGVGLQVSTALGPMRIDAAYNGYGNQPGPLYQIYGTELVLVDPAYHSQSQNGSFLSHLQWNFNVGLAF
jgi:outer membrane protein assembly complex protein YaeT